MRGAAEEAAVASSAQPAASALRPGVAEVAASDAQVRPRAVAAERPVASARQPGAAAGEVAVSGAQV
jgi:hypothetical protein